MSMDFFTEAANMMRVAVDTDQYLEDVREEAELEVDDVDAEEEADDRAIDDDRDEEFSTWGDA